MTINTELLEQIKQKEFYSAREIANEGFIKNNKRNGHDYNFILKAIRENMLTAEDMNPNGKKPTYRIYAHEIINYLESH